ARRQGGQGARRQQQHGRSFPMEVRCWGAEAGGEAGARAAGRRRRQETGEGWTRRNEGEARTKPRRKANRGAQSEGEVGAVRPGRRREPRWRGERFSVLAQWRRAVSAPAMAGTTVS